MLPKIARGDHRSIELNPGDTVIFSSRAIPGNEREIIDVKNRLVEAGVRVISPRDTKHTIHVSGHACRDEIADTIVETMRAADYTINEQDPFEDQARITLSHRQTSPHVNRMKMRWAIMREQVLEHFPPAPGLS